ATVAGMRRDWPDSHARRGARFRLFREGNSERRGIGRAAVAVLGIISVVLFLACFNVANLLLARAVERERDMGIRAALGAGARHLMRLVVAGGFLLAAVGGGWRVRL